MSTSNPVNPPNNMPAYRSSSKRAPLLAPITLPSGQGMVPGPHLGHAALRERVDDLSQEGRAQGQRILVHGHVVDERGRPEANSLVEIWQANAAGRYRHAGDLHDAPLDPHFHGAGQFLTDAAGYYRFLSIEPGAYPWGNHHNGWRPRHIHFSLFGLAWASRLVTQMYFPGDPLLPFDPIFMGIPDAVARERLVSALDLEATVPGVALAYRFDIVLRGPRDTPFEPC